MREERNEPWTYEPKERLCDIAITIVRYGGVKIAYSPESGLKRQMYLEGHVEDYDNDRRFRGKSIKVRIESPVNPEKEARIKAEEKIEHACGWFGVRANVEPRDFEKEFGTPPIQASVNVTTDTFDAVARHVTETVDRLGRAHATIRLAGKSLPETGSGVSELPILLSDLDVSEDKNYAIRSFEVAGTRALYPRKRVLPIERELGDRGGTSLSVLLTGANFILDVPNAKAYSAGCYGTLTRTLGKSYEHARVSVKFEEFHMRGVGGLPFELDPADKLPDRALFGYFRYWPKNLERDSSFDVTLNYLLDDAHNLILPVLNQVVSAQVTLTIDLMNEEAEILDATELLEGNVRGYRFRVRNSPANEEG